MSTRLYDIIVYGATGFTGKRVAKHLIQTHPTLKVAISGRDLPKLTTVANEIGLSPTHILLAPTTDQNLLIQALSQAQLVIACAGPYRHFGSALVQAAIAAQTDYLDLCGEPQFFDDMLAQYDAAARTNRTLVISACAFDCVPAELTAKLACRELKNKYDSTPVTNLEVVHTFEHISCGNPTTFHAAVDGFHAAITGELKESREKVKQVLKLKRAPACPAAWPKFVNSPGTSPVYHPETNTYLLKFMGADAACILASDRYLRYTSSMSSSTSSNSISSSREEPIPPHPRMSVCFGVPSKSAAYKILAYGGIFSTLARFKYGCKLLHANPELFTNGFFREGGPTEEEMALSTFKTYCSAYGMSREQCVKVTCEGPEPGYVATPKIIVALALTVLKHRDGIPFEGGVMVPGVAFGECDEAYNMLRKEGIVIEVVNEEGADGGV